MENNLTTKDLFELKKPLKNKWRVQSAYPRDNPKNVIMVAYTDARDVQNRLDDVCGIGGWQNRFYEVKGKQFCDIGIKINNEWVWKGDCGTESQTEKEKGETSDAFKRAAVQWGINRFAYSYGTVKLPCMIYNKKPYPSNDSRTKFLKGDDLFKVCDEKAKVEEFDQLFEYEKSQTLN